jgi:hypothetical protein
MSILEIKMNTNDAKAETVKGYLKALLRELWRKGEGFSGKRPFGNSGWEYDLYEALVAAKAVAGSLDEDGRINEVDEKAANALIFEAIDSL